MLSAVQQVQLPSSGEVTIVLSRGVRTFEQAQFVHQVAKQLGDRRVGVVEITMIFGHTSMEFCEGEQAAQLELFAPFPEWMQLLLRPYGQAGAAIAELAIAHWHEHMEHSAL